MEITKERFDDDMNRLAENLLSQLKECEEVNEFSAVEVEGFGKQDGDGNFKVYFSFLVTKPDGEDTIFGLY